MEIKKPAAFIEVTLPRRHILSLQISASSGIANECLFCEQPPDAPR